MTGQGLVRAGLLDDLTDQVDRGDLRSARSVTSPSASGCDALIDSQPVGTGLEVRDQAPARMRVSTSRALIEPVAAKLHNDWITR